MDEIGAVLSSFLGFTAYNAIQPYKTILLLNDGKFLVGPLEPAAARALITDQ